MDCYDMETKLPALCGQGHFDFPHTLRHNFWWLELIPQVFDVREVLMEQFLCDTLSALVAGVLVAWMRQLLPEGLTDADSN